MILRGYKKEGNWIYAEWKLTFLLKWRQMIYAVASAVPLIDNYSVFYGKSDFELRDITNAVMAHNGNLIETGLLRVKSNVLRIRGTISDMPIDITMSSDSEFVQMTLFYDGELPEDADNVVIPWLYESFGSMLDSMEIVGHVRGVIDSITKKRG